MAEPESLRHIARSRGPVSTWLGVVLLFALFGVIVLAIIGPMPRGSDYEEMRAKKRMENLKTAQEDAEKALNTYAWVDKNKGVVRIPIGRAMELTATDLAQKKPVAAGPIATSHAAQASGGGGVTSNRSCFRDPRHESMIATATGIPLKEPAVSAGAGDTEQLERAYIDASTRVPVLMFYTSAMAWLILGTLLAGFVSFKLHSRSE